jgi:hypothetical protein
MAEKEKPSYDYICFSELVYEFDPASKKKIEDKIKRRLKYYGAGVYDQERVDYIRILRHDLYAEISSYDKSRFFKKTDSPYTVLADFDLAAMTDEYAGKYPAIDRDGIASMIHFAVYLFYTR